MDLDVPQDVSTALNAIEIEDGYRILKQNIRLFVHTLDIKPASIQGIFSDKLTSLSGLQDKRDD
jgi:hypothetical protein